MTIRYVVLKKNKKFQTKETEDSIWLWGLSEKKVLESMVRGHMIYGSSRGVEFDGECIIASGSNRDHYAEIARRTKGKLERWEYHSGGVRKFTENVRWRSPYKRNNK